MRRRCLVLCLVLMGALRPAIADGQGLVEIDLCDLVSYSDETKRKEYQALTSKLNLSPAVRDALEQRRTLAPQLARRLSSELLELWKQTLSLVMTSVRSHEADEAQIILMDRCLDRLRHNPAQEAAVVRLDNEAIRSLLALSDAELERRFRTRMNALHDSLGSPASANQTLRINLGLPVPH